MTVHRTGVKALQSRYSQTILVSFYLSAYFLQLPVKTVIVYACVFVLDVMSIKSTSIGACGSNSLMLVQCSLRLTVRSIKRHYINLVLWFFRRLKSLLTL